MNIIEKYPKTIGFLVLGIWFYSEIRPSPPHSSIQPMPLIGIEKPSSDFKVIDFKQQDCLAWNIYHEGRNQPALGQLAIGITTYVRAQEAKWPDSICAVVKQPHQFSWVGKKRSKTEKFDELSYYRALSMAGEILNGDYDNLLPLFSPTYFHTTGVKPSWSKHKEKLLTIKDHVFYE